MRAIGQCSVVPAELFFLYHVSATAIVPVDRSLGVNQKWERAPEVVRGPEELRVGEITTGSERIVIELAIVGAIRAMWPVTPHMASPRATDQYKKTSGGLTPKILEVGHPLRLRGREWG